MSTLPGADGGPTWEGRILRLSQGQNRTVQHHTHMFHANRLRYEVYMFILG